MYDMILIRYGEMTLKKKNYKQFLQKINQNIKSKLQSFSRLSFSNTSYRFYIYLNGENHEQVIEKINEVVGIYSYSLCKKVTNDIADIADNAVNILKEDHKDNKTFSFKVETHRGDKSYPLTSLEISSAVASIILPQIENITVDVHNPDVVLNIDLRKEGTYIFTSSIRGLGGYPSGIAGGGLVMMSGGIDSPVATFLSIKKGINVEAIHFESFPYTSKMALQKVIDLTKRLAAYSSKGYINLHVVNFTNIQDQIHQKCDPIYMITLMRRFMYEIASQIVMNRELDCIINGESIGQVASQTLESIKVVNNVTNLPIIRPLATYDKEEIIKIAKAIKTFDISIRPYEDCCTVFVPKHPIIKPKLVEVLQEEKKLLKADLIKEAISSVVTYKVEENGELNVFETEKMEKFDI